MPYKDPEKQSEWKREWARKHRDYERSRTAKWKANNPEKCKEYSERFKERNPDYHSRKSREFIERNKGYRLRPYVRLGTYISGSMAKAPCSTPDGSREFMEYSWSLGSAYHLDHIIPVSKGGTNDIDNLQILPAEINHYKNGMLESEMLASFDRFGIPHSVYYDHRVLPSDILDDQ